MIEIIPSIFAHSQQEFEHKLRLVEHACKMVQVDILDGSLFNNVTWFDAMHIKALRTPVEYELHLMVENPLPIIEEGKQHIDQLKRVIVHAELDRPVGTILSHCKERLHLETAVALNPASPLEEVHAILPHVDQVTLMGVHPGKTGQTFGGESILEKIRMVKHHYPEIIVEVDGGVTEKLLETLAKAGCDRITATSLLFSFDNPTERLEYLNNLASTL